MTQVLNLCSQHFYVSNKIPGEEKPGSWMLLLGTSWSQFNRATLPPTWFFGHHHSGVGVCLPALAHHTFEVRGKKKKKKILNNFV